MEDKTVKVIKDVLDAALIGGYLLFVYKLFRRII